VTGSLSDNFNYYKVALLMLGIGGGMSKGYIVILKGIKVVLKQLTNSSLNYITLLFTTTLLYN